MRKVKVITQYADYNQSAKWVEGWFHKWVTLDEEGRDGYGGPKYTVRKLYGVIESSGGSIQTYEFKRINFLDTPKFETTK